MSNELFSPVQPAEVPEKRFPEPLQRLFSQLSADDVAQFTTAYKLWTLHQQINFLNLQIALKRQEIASNAEQLRLVQPTALALATLAQLQSNGVRNADLLDRLHARGEAWLDYVIQLLAHCERMGLIQGDYTEWCEHALEGAYDWISSIDDDDLSSAENHREPSVTVAHDAIEDSATYDEQAEALLLRKLFLEAGEELPEEIEPASELPHAASSTIPSDEKLLPADALLDDRDEELVPIDALLDHHDEEALPYDDAGDMPLLDHAEILPAHESSEEAFLSDDTDKMPVLKITEKLPLHDNTTEETLSPDDIEDAPSPNSVEALSPDHDRPDDEEEQPAPDATSSPDLATPQQDHDLSTEEQAEKLASEAEEILPPEGDEPPARELEESREIIIIEQAAETSSVEETVSTDAASDEEFSIEEPASIQEPSVEEPVSVQEPSAEMSVSVQEPSAEMSVSIQEPSGEELLSSDRGAPGPPIFVDAELPRAQKDQKSTAAPPAQRIGLIARILNFFFPKREAR